MTLVDELGWRYSNKNILKKVGGRCSWFLDEKIQSNRLRAQVRSRILSRDDAIYWQQLSEIIVADILQDSGFNAVHPNNGPDFLISHLQSRVWIEVITPKPQDIPLVWLENGASKPAKEILLRWTAAIKEKFKKIEIHLSNIKKPECCVISVNSILLRKCLLGYPDIYAVGGIPYVLQAVCGVGEASIEVELGPNGPVGSADFVARHRISIPKTRGNPVPAGGFLSDELSSVSAIWALDVDENSFFGNPAPDQIIVVHNPNATCPLPANFLPAHREYSVHATSSGYDIEWTPGRLQPRSG